MFFILSDLFKIISNKTDFYLSLLSLLHRRSPTLASLEPGCRGFPWLLPLWTCGTAPHPAVVWSGVGTGLCVRKGT